ncbi:hypothetical protein A1O1_01281 [Capronia coronata CBS 617.96]|uniref:Uncharacterized protein n=1 Tax=Capronia coronata CBS 617.96 TaxID=1182541 RepID=W9Z2H0_9EURO|nr:uncharacterized protein A1O1_01281 [Capronia coronata CBS 617.96]EXJ96155.1 hypothetical protein A1O1_01281 [Capronia coronata CBS 617.96]
MGGSAFAPEKLSTPRMPPDVYNSTLARVEALLRPHFKHVGHAIEAPAKTSYGDIDVLVAEPVSAMESVTGDFLAEVLGAEKWKRTGGSSTFNLALRWPRPHELDSERVDHDAVQMVVGSGATVTHRSELGVKVEAARTTSIEPNTASEDNILHMEGNSKSVYGSHNQTADPNCDTLTTTTAKSDKYVQIDITVCPTASYLRWHLFFQAHGDLWNILGSIIRRHGLTCTSKGLCLRIAEVEAHNKEHSRVKMTDDPSTVLEYLGLDVERFWNPFASWDEMMAYAASCRFHYPGRWKEKEKEKEKEKGKETNEKEKEKQNQSNTPTEIETEEKTKLAGSQHKAPTTNATAEKGLYLKANDRQRAAKRPVFGYWISEYLPKHRDDPSSKDAHLSRDQVVDDVKRYFGPEFARTFDDRRNKWVRQIGVDQLWADIRSLPVEGVEIGYVIKGMKREIACCVEDNPGLDDSADVRIAFLQGRFQDVLSWAKTNCREVGERQKMLDRVKSRAHLIEKRKQDEEKAKEEGKEVNDQNSSQSGPDGSKKQ